MAGSQRSGKGSRIKVGAVNLNMADWDATDRGDDLDTTTFEDSGRETGLVGVEVVEWNVGGDWDASRNPFDSPPGFYPRADLASLQLYENVADNVGWVLPLNRVLSARNGAQVRGKVSFQASGKSNGSTWTRPTGSL